MKPQPSSSPPPPHLLLLLDGARLQAALVAAIELRLFERMAERATSAGEIARAAAIAPRGAQALLDALVALGLAEVSDGVYRPSPLAATYFLPGRPDYLGEEQVALHRATQAIWGGLTELARTGEPAHEIDSPEMLAFWEILTPIIARRGRPAADAAIERLGLAAGEPHLLDVGGGSAALYSLALLARNRRARATQLDWPHINRGAREAARAAGCEERFAIIDGDFRKVELGAARYDVAVLSNIMHQESPETNRALLRKLHAALRPSGRLLVTEFVVEDGRTGPPSSLLFNLNMLAHTRDGKAYTRSELAELCRDGGFGAPTFTPVGPLWTQLVAPAAPEAR